MQDVQRRLLSENEENTRSTTLGVTLSIDTRQ